RCRTGLAGSTRESSRNQSFVPFDYITPLPMGDWVNCPYLFAYYRDCNLPPVRRMPMFEDKNSLPGAQLHFTADDRNGFARPGQDHPNMGRHVVRSFSIVLEIIGILRHQTVEKFLQ